MRNANNNNSAGGNTNNNNNLNNNNNNMDSLYEENAQFSNQNCLKRPLTLDLNQKPQAKKQRFNSSVNAPPVLSSPDMQMLKLASPELERMMNDTLETPTPSLIYPTKVTTEQEDFSRGFVDALNSLRNNNGECTEGGGQKQQTTQPVVTIQPPQTVSQNVTKSSTTILSTVGMSGGSITYTNLDESYPVAIKDEPQTVPNSPPHSPMHPIDMETQEKIKLERKRQRNRVAASKCRKRKLERISKLEDKVKNLKGENTELANLIKNLKEHVFQLKQQVIDHTQTGCQIRPYNVQIFLKDGKNM